MDTVPMSFIIGGSDSTCQASVANDFINQIKAQNEVLTIDYREHGYFGENATSEYFMRHLMEQLDLHWF
jgi:tRNA(Ile)-lysidine synthase TilS/MesJ